MAETVKVRYEIDSQSAEVRVEALEGDMRGVESRVKMSDSAFKAFAASVERVSASLRRIGDRMTRTLTLPLLAAGGAAVKMAADLETEFSRIENLVGITGDSLKELRDGTLAISRATGRGPGELAKALFLVTSNGLRGAEALRVLEAAAKASVVGLGEVDVVATTLLKVTTAYAKEGLTAARALELIAGAVREGQLETTELAGALTNVTGFAAAAGVSFRDVAAFVATYSRQGKDAATATNDLRALIVALAAPLAEAKKNTEGMAIGIEDVSRELREKGLIPALLLLEKATGGNTAAMREFLPSQEAMRGALQVLGSQSEELSEIWGRLGPDLDIVEEGFRKASQTANERFRRALNNVRIAGIELGAELLPIVEKIVDKVAAWTKAFSELGDGTKKVTIAAGGLLLILGPILSTLGRIAALVKGIATAFRVAAPAALLFTRGIAAALRAAAAAALLFARNLAAVRAASLGIAGTIGAYTVALYAYAKAGHEAKAATEDATGALAAYQRQINRAERDLFGHRRALEGIAVALQPISMHAGVAAGATGEYVKALQAWVNTERERQGLAPLDFSAVADGADDAKASVSELDKELEKWMETLDSDGELMRALEEESREIQSLIDENREVIHRIAAQRAESLAKGKPASVDQSKVGGDITDDEQAAILAKNQERMTAAEREAQAIVDAEARKREAREETLKSMLGSVDTEIRTIQDVVQATIEGVRAIIQAKLAETIAKSLAAAGPAALFLGPAIAAGLNLLFNSLLSGLGVGSARASGSGGGGGQITVGGSAGSGQRVSGSIAQAPSPAAYVPAIPLGAGMGGAPMDTAAILAELRATREAFEGKQFTVRGTDLHTVNARVQSLYDAAGMSR
jgi:TP901 family phage tail tape measure protein